MGLLQARPHLAQYDFAQCNCTLSKRLKYTQVEVQWHVAGWADRCVLCFIECSQVTASAEPWLMRC